MRPSWSSRKRSSWSWSGARGGNEDPVPGGLGGGDLVCKLRLVGLDLAGLDEGHLIARLGEGVDARVERLERLVVVVLRPAQTLEILEGGLRIHHRLLRRQFLLLEPAPQLVDVDVGIDGTALGPDRPRRRSRRCGSRRRRAWIARAPRAGPSRRGCRPGAPRRRPSPPRWPSSPQWRRRSRYGGRNCRWQYHRPSHRAPRTALSPSCRSHRGIRAGRGCRASSIPAGRIDSDRGASRRHSRSRTLRPRARCDRAAGAACPRTPRRPSPRRVTVRRLLGRV